MQAAYWVETKGLTLEEIDVLFDDNKHSDVPNIEQLIAGREHVDASVLEKQLAGANVHEEDLK
jgi:hypothetical protein